MRDWLKIDFGPEFKKSDFWGKVKLLILDDVKIFLPFRADTILAYDENDEIVNGIGLHWYMNYVPDIMGNPMDRTYNRHPDKFLIGTEACHEATPLKDRINRDEQWHRGMKYSEDIIHHLNHHSSGWIDWNLALDEAGGPNWAHNYVDSPILINAAEQEFYLQPMYWHMVHFSKLLEKGSTVVDYKLTDDDKQWLHKKHVKMTAVERLDGSIALTVLNMDSKEYSLYIENLAATVMIPEHSLLSFVFWLEN